MIDPVETKLFLAPTKEWVAARIVTLTSAMIDEQLSRAWWEDPDLMPQFNPAPIDRHWNWNDISIDYEGRVLEAEKVAIVTVQGDQEVVQGAMLISVEPVPSICEQNTHALFIELLFTAPRNRMNLRKDGCRYLTNIGLSLLTWGAWLSREKGYEGGLRLDGSPDFLWWYEKIGLQRLKIDPILFDGVEYTPMELPKAAAAKLLSE